MTTNTSIGNEDDETVDLDGKAEKKPPGHDLTREEIASGNDQATSADQGNRSGRTNRIADDGVVELGK